MTFELPKLPYDRTALEPHMSAQTIDFHYGKHHKAYVDKANELTKGTDLEDADLETAVIKSYIQGGGAVFNNLAQAYNHVIFWQSLTPNGEGKAIPSELENRIKEEFGSVEKFKEAFKTAGMGQFGSGWVWLAINADGELEIIKTSNAENPLIMGKLPLLACDVWEHTYYLDYQNKRADFLDVFVNKLANWEFANEQFEKAMKALASGGCGSCGGSCSCGCGDDDEEDEGGCHCGSDCNCGH